MSEAADVSTRWGRIFSVLLVLFLLLEASTRIGIFRWAGKPYASLRGYVWSPYGLVRNNPDFTSPGFQIDHQGFRSVHDFAKSKPSKTLRVMILGGSAMYSGVGGPKLIKSWTRVDSRSTIAQFLEKELRSDPELAGLDVECINAAIGFNRIVEVTEAFIKDGVLYEPDVVILGGSYNNFAGKFAAGDFYARRLPFQMDHPWALEFERQANGMTFAALGERAVQVAEHYSAAAAVAKKLGSDWLLDRTSTMVQAYAQASGILASSPQPQYAPASDDEYERSMTEYLGYADALFATAQRHKIDVAYFWENLLAQVGGIKPLSDEERDIFEAVKADEAWRLSTDVFMRTRDYLRAYLEGRRIPFIDPLDALRNQRETVFIDYLHYTANGNRFMAHVMYERLKDVFHERARRIREQAGESSAPSPVRSWAATMGN